MGTKESTLNLAGTNAMVKPEPQEQPMPLLGSPTRQNAAKANPEAVKVKPEGSENSLGSPKSLKHSDSLHVPDTLEVKKTGLERSLSNMDIGLNKPKPFTEYASAQEVPYTPENALAEGVGMVKHLKSKIKKMEIGSKMRKDVWLREMENLQSQGAPSTMIAVCGATGAGKSSILNAILDDNIVPTSGMRACTAVVTEIAYHKEKTIAADVSFLSEKEWREELRVLLDDLIDEDGSIKRTTNLNSDAGIAWSKVHAVYPSITQDQIGNMTADQIIARDPRIAKILGTTKKIVAKDSKTFAQEIAKYIDSKDQKRGDKKDKKKKEEEKAKGKDGGSLMDLVRGATGKDKSKKDKDVDGPAFWPLIRQVNVRCNSQALSTGAILVDLPGVADANAARNSIAKDYMKKCNCIWILAPITRAVDDKTAKDLLGDAFKSQLMNGNYDAHIITFIASKCDDISCSEVIGALGLDDDPELEAIEDRIQECKDQSTEWKEKESEAKAVIKDIDTQLKQVRAMGKEYQEHLEALKNGEEFTPRLTGKVAKKKKAVNAGKKRKRSQKDKSSKRRKTDGSDDEDEDIDMDDAGSLDSFIASDDSDSDSDKDDDDDDDKSDSSKSGSGSDDSDKEEDEEDADEEVTEESLKAKIDESKAAIKAGRERLNEMRQAKKEASDMLSTLKKKQVKAQREKNAFCSLKRSEFSRDVLKEDFRQGLKELDDAAAEQRDPESFDPTQNLRDYSAIDLPVFTCSARDYVRLKGQVKGDGDPTCFSNPADTGVPALQEWCQTLTVSSRERAARNFHTHLAAFAKSVRQYIECAGEVTETDRALLKEKWESGYVHNEDEDGFENSDDDEDGYRGGWDDSDGDMDAEFLRTLTGGAYAGALGGRGLYTMHDRAPKVDAWGEPAGITPRLVKDFGKIVDKSVQDLKAEFREGLQEKCEASAELASNMAVETSDSFASSMHWASYRATLRRHGTFRRDLNVELISPMTRNIASSWSKVFEADLFASFGQSVSASVTKLLKEIEDTAATGLKDRVKTQAEACMEEARVVLKKIIDIVKETMNDEQKEVSRCIAPHIQQQLFEGYEDAMAERGTGSVARQKAVFHNFISDNKENIFHGGADTIMERLNKAADAVGAALKTSLRELAEKVEVSVAVLWEGVRDDAAQVNARAEVIESIAEIDRQLSLWSMAREMRDAADAQKALPAPNPAPEAIMAPA